MGKHETPAPEDSLYERDFYAWTQEQAARLRDRAHNEIDWENAAEEIESLGRSDKRQIRNRLNKLLVHLLKWEFQPDKREGGWRATIREQRARITDLIKESPSFRDLPAAALDQEYAHARLTASDEAKLRLSRLPVIYSHPIDLVLDDAFYPGLPWSPDDADD